MTNETVTNTVPPVIPDNHNNDNAVTLAMPPPAMQATGNTNATESCPVTHVAAPQAPLTLPPAPQVAATTMSSDVGGGENAVSVSGHTAPITTVSNSVSEEAVNVEVVKESKSEEEVAVCTASTV